MNKAVILRDFVLSQGMPRGNSVRLLLPDVCDADRRAGGLYNPSVFAVGDDLRISFRHAPQIFVVRRDDFGGYALRSVPPIQQCSAMHSEIYYCEATARDNYLPGHTSNLFPGFTDTLDNHVKSVEDFRFSEVSGSVVKGYCCVPGDGYRNVTMYLMARDLKNGDIVSVPLESPARYEKNWSPVLDGSGRVLYSPRAETPVVLGQGGGFPVLPDTAVPVGRYRGSTQTIPYGDGYLTIWHCTEGLAYMRKWQYWHVFVLMDRDLCVKSISEPFLFDGFPVEFACGLAFAGGLLHVTYSVMDALPFHLTMTPDTLDAFFSRRHSPSLTPLAVPELYEDVLRRVAGAGWVYPYFNICQVIAAHTPDVRKAGHYYKRAMGVIPLIEFPYADNADNQRESLVLETARQIQRMKIIYK